MKTTEFPNQYIFTDDEKLALDELLAFPTLKNFEQNKKKIVIKYKLNRFPSNSQIIKRARDLNIHDNHPWIKHLNRKPTRSISGVSVVAIMLPPDLGTSKGYKGSCPFSCAYCPSAENAPKSYIGKEPSTLRAINYNYNPYEITKGRIEQLRLIGHSANKIQVVLQGGTFLAMPEVEQDRVLKDIFNGIIDQPANTIEEAMQLMETSENRCIGITYETRPDFCKQPHVDRILNRLGTMIEIGVQTLSNDVLKKVKRGHKVKDVYEANQIARDAGFKITFHMMPNLYSTPEDDIGYFSELFNNTDLKPDGLKIYPLLVMEGTEVFNDWKNGNFNPYSDEELIDALAKIKNELPEYTRIHRIQRDIPGKYVSGGLHLGNLRNIVKDKMEEFHFNCSCIRCREIGIVQNQSNYLFPPKEDLELETFMYDSCGGKEYFLSIVDPLTRVLFGFLRLRFPSPDAHRPEITSTTAIVRELHVYGKELQIGGSPDREQSQHRGMGRKLMNEAEKLSIDNGYNELVVISGVGVREYYKKLGYFQKGPYMARNLEI
jgi:elongator complex protein 3